MGPVVTSTMLATDHDCKKAIGSVNTAEFIVTVAETAAFLVFVSDFLANWQTIAELVIRGIIAAPIAHACAKSSLSGRFLL